MSTTLKLGVLVSGSGSNLQALLDAIARAELDATIQLVLSNEPSAYALSRAQAAQVPSRCVPHREFPNREAFDQRLIQELERADIEWVVLAGFMRLLTPQFIDRFKNRVLNIHPSLLPAFPGTHAIRQALEHGVKVTGCTVHLVDHGLDSGPILAQAAVPVLPGDTEQALTERVHSAEHQLYVQTLRELSTCDLIFSAVPGGSRSTVVLRPR